MSVSPRPSANKQGHGDGFQGTRDSLKAGRSAVCTGVFAREHSSARIWTCRPRKDLTRLAQAAPLPPAGGTLSSRSLRERPRLEVTGVPLGGCESPLPVLWARLGHAAPRAVGLFRAELGPARKVEAAPVASRRPPCQGGGQNRRGEVRFVRNRRAGSRSPFDLTSEESAHPSRESPQFRHERQTGGCEGRGKAADTGARGL